MIDPFAIIKRRHITEKASVLESLHTAESNRSLSRCKTPKYLFVVDPKANKYQIAEAVRAIYGVKVLQVNTIQVKAKATGRRRRGRPGKKAGFKKAIVTLAEGQILETVAS